MQTLDYTICSTDYNHNNRIYTNLSSPRTEYCKMTITTLTTMANFIVLDKSDYFIINGVKYCIDSDFSDVSVSSLTEYLNQIVNDTSNPNELTFYYDTCSRIYITSLHEFVLTECSYNLKLLLGLVNVELPLSSTQIPNLYYMLFPDVGMYLSTPVLYLASNLGSNCYKNTSDSFTSMRILMRITNSFYAKQPIINPNGDYTTTVRCTDLSDARFTLIDANYHEVKLLSPMYLTVQIEAIPDVKQNEEQHIASSNIQSMLIMNEYAYLQDNTERGKDVDMNTIDSMIYMNMPESTESNESTSANDNSSNS